MQAVDGVLLPLAAETDGLPGGGLALSAWSNGFVGAIMSYRCTQMCTLARLKFLPARSEPHHTRQLVSSPSQEPVKQGWLLLRTASFDSDCIPVKELTSCL